MLTNKETVGRVLFTEEMIRQRAHELGEQISRDYAGEPLVLLCTLKGSVVWMGDLMKEITIDTEIDFISASSYGSSTSSSGVVKISKDVKMDLFQKNVLIVEDIVDTGNTLAFMRDYLKERNPKSVKICTMLDKPSRRTADVVPDYIGFTVDDLFIIGYGLDFDQKYRNLPYVSYLDH
ncbi:MAG: hypoxanthine phosphoribosyltransferase [Firmicutes bacterium]|nr:hypoxanthine phosphoribosyltransferase [Bacillota bacterium]MBQ6662206.1 hypoxanthine phosphoribosyltransferase [Bacillota bacterium]MCR4712314.1 hypoxanthine phosphoribosyltransferase [Clostridia bacterium]